MFVNDTTGITVALHVDDGLVPGTPAAQTEFYADRILRRPREKIQVQTPDIPHRNSSANIRGVHYSGIQRLRRSPHALD